MNAKLLPEPERWSERTGGNFANGESSAEDAIGGSLRRIRTATEPSAAATARWARQAMAASPRPSAPARIWSFAIIATILGGASVVAARVAWRAVVQRAPAKGAESAPATAARKHRATVALRESTPAAIEAPPGEAPPADELLPAAPTASPPLLPAMKSLPAAPKAPAPPLLPAMKSLPAAPKAPAPPPESVSPVFEPAPLPAGTLNVPPGEALLVTRAFRRMRNEGDARGALEALDERDRRFPSGALGTESALARVEALLRLGRGDDALPILMGIDNPRAGLTPDVRVTRAELLARAKRCAEAQADFDELLAPGAPTPAATRERALYGRASCALQASAPDRARRDLESYLAEYPDGRFAPAVRAALYRIRL
jgi:hypothetical protein